MTRKDYEAAARLIGMAALNLDDRERLTALFSAFFREENPRFDHTRFCLAVRTAFARKDS